MLFFLWTSLNNLFISLHPCSVNQFFTLDVYNSDGSPLSEDQLLTQLQKICDSSSQSSEEPVGILTSQDRNVWGKAYLELIKGKLSASPCTAVCKDKPGTGARRRLFWGGFHMASQRRRQRWSTVSRTVYLSGRVLDWHAIRLHPSRAEPSAVILGKQTWWWSKREWEPEYFKEIVQTALLRLYCLLSPDCSTEVDNLFFIRCFVCLKPLWAPSK